jgi:hypothetical protein
VDHSPQFKINKMKDANMTPEQDAGMLAKIVEWAWAGVAAMIAIVWKANASAIQKAQETADAAVTKADFNEHLIRAEASRGELRDGIIDLYKGQSKIAESLARIEGKLEK